MHDNQTVYVCVCVKINSSFCQVVISALMPQRGGWNHAGTEDRDPFQGVKWAIFQHSGVYVYVYLALVL